MVRFPCKKLGHVSMAKVHSANYIRWSDTINSASLSDKPMLKRQPALSRVRTVPFSRSSIQTEIEEDVHIPEIEKQMYSFF